VTVHARTVDVPEGDWPYADRPAEAGAGEPRAVPLVPYHAWGNRGPSTMRVWMPVG
jgi:DUF1680 family protein